MYVSIHRQPSVDISQIAAAVFKEFRIRAELLSVSPDPRHEESWTVKFQPTLPPRREMQITVRCGPHSSPLDVRRSLKRQLGLE